MSDKKILIVEDDRNLLDTLVYNVEKEGYTVITSMNGEEAIESARIENPDMIILDLMLPGLNGLEVCRILRKEMTAPILMLTARNEEVDKIIGLEVGADDYMTKPFNPRELVARVKAILRRTGRPTEATDPLRVGDLAIDPARREVQVVGKPIELRTQEFDLLLTFVEHKGLVLGREQLLNLAWGYDFYGQTRTVDVHVAHLRKKLAESSVKIETVTGVGYKLVA